MGEDERRDLINGMGGYQRVFDAIAGAVSIWPSKECATGISVSVFKFVEALHRPDADTSGTNDQSRDDPNSPLPTSPEVSQ